MHFIEDVRKLMKGDKCQLGVSSTRFIEKLIINLFIIYCCTDISPSGNSVELTVGPLQGDIHV
jgi:hypothetical protein